VSRARCGAQALLRRTGTHASPNTSVRKVLGPGSAVRRSALHCVRGTVAARPLADMANELSK